MALAPLTLSAWLRRSSMAPLPCQGTPAAMVHAPPMASPDGANVCVNGSGPMVGGRRPDVNVSDVVRRHRLHVHHRRRLITGAASAPPPSASPPPPPSRRWLRF